MIRPLPPSHLPPPPPVPRPPPPTHLVGLGGEGLVALGPEAGVDGAGQGVLRHALHCEAREQVPQQPEE